MEKINNILGKINMIKSKSKILFIGIIILCLLATQAVGAADIANGQNLTIDIS